MYRRLLGQHDERVGRNLGADHAGLAAGRGDPGGSGGDRRGGDPGRLRGHGGPQRGDTVSKLVASVAPPKLMVALGDIPQERVRRVVWKLQTAPI